MITERAKGRIEIRSYRGSVDGLEERCNELESAGHGDVLSVTHVDDGQSGFWTIVLRKTK